MKQMQIDFEAGLLIQYPEFRDCVKASVYSCGRPLKSIAADLDMSVSELSRKLTDNPNDLVHFPNDLFDKLIEATGDKRPLYWLIEKFMEDPVAKKQRVIEEASGLVKRLGSLLDAIEPDKGLRVAK